MRLLDLFCCAGGATRGYQQAGFEVVGVDIRRQPNYVGDGFHQADALTFPLDGFDAVHASPPCQSYSDLAKRNGNADAWPRLIEPVRERLIAAGLPYVIENVEGAPLVDPVVLCGTMFGGLRVLRHRLFESNVHLAAPAHPRHPLVFTHDKRKAHYGRLDQNVSFVQVTGGGNATVANKAAAMGIDWMTGAELNEAIPPAYTRWIGCQLASHIDDDTDDFLEATKGVDWAVFERDHLTDIEDFRMTAFVRLECDHIDRDGLACETVSENGAYTIREARKLARAEGWTHRHGQPVGDFCRAHSAAPLPERNEP